MAKSYLLDSVTNVTNPITEMREYLALSQQKLAQELNVNAQTIVQAEAGCFPEIPEVLLNWLYKFHHHPRETPVLYKKFVTAKRQEAREELVTRSLHWTLPTSALQPPVTCLADTFKVTLTQFCKKLAVLPATAYRLKTGKARALSSQYENALRECGATQQYLNELNDWQADFFYSLHKPGFKELVENFEKSRKV